jgi:hypothetical protein
MHILTPAAYAAVESPPVFTSVERKRFFHLSPRLENFLATFRTPTNQICFVLTLGYFKATHRFFARQFHEADAAYVATQLSFFPGLCDLRTYDEGTARRHRQLILDHLGFQPLDAPAQPHLLPAIRTLVRSHVRPKAMLLYALDLLARRKTEIPRAHLLTELIVSEIRRHKGTLTEMIDAHIPVELRALLNALLEKPESAGDPTPQMQRFKLTRLKKISQSTKPAKIHATLEDWQTLRMLYDQLAPIIASLDLTHDGLGYYANAVLKSQVFQVSRRNDDDRHLHLVCCIAHQFYR